MNRDNELNQHWTHIAGAWVYDLFFLVLCLSVLYGAGWLIGFIIENMQDV